MSRLPRPVRCPGGEPDVAHAVESRSLAAELGRSCQPPGPVVDLGYLHRIRSAHHHRLDRRPPPPSRAIRHPRRTHLSAASRPAPRSSETDHQSAPRQRRPAEPGHFRGHRTCPPRSAPRHPETDAPASRHCRLRRSGRAARDGLARVGVEQRARAVQARCGPDGRWRLVPRRRVEAQNCSSSRTSTWP